MTISPAQLRAARALLRLSPADLSGSAVVPITAIVDYEEDVATPRPADLDALRAALERAGVEFTDGEGVAAQPGSRLAKAGRQPAFQHGQARRQGLRHRRAEPEGDKKPEVSRREGSELRYPAVRMERVAQDAAR
jgi:hypothetical protein